MCVWGGGGAGLVIPAPGSGLASLCLVCCHKKLSRACPLIACLLTAIHDDPSKPEAQINLSSLKFFQVFFFFIATCNLRQILVQEMRLLLS